MDSTNGHSNGTNGHAAANGNGKYLFSNKLYSDGGITNYK